MVKRELIFIMCFMILLGISSIIVSAQNGGDLINLEIEKKTINDVVVKELSAPATFEFTIKNNGPSDNFEIYSFIGISFSPKGNFFIPSGGTKKLIVEARADESAKQNEGYFSFGYKIHGTNTGIQDDRLIIRIVKLKNVIGLKADSINPESEETTVYIENKEQIEFSEIEAEFSAAFFTQKEKFKLSPLEEKSFKIDIEKGMLMGLNAGPYILNANLKTEGTEANLESTIQFLEKADTATIETKEGFFVYRHEIEKKNEGNVPVIVQISMEKNIFARVFTTFNLPYYKKESKGSSILYTWQEELSPGQGLKVVAKTNWFILILLIIAIIVIVVLWRKYLATDLVLKKRISHVKTKGGEFALKVSILVKARRYVEKINIIDKLPPVVKLFERYGTITPDRIDEKNRRIEWNLESLNENEETVLSYIVYSKISFVGKFELPAAAAVYEREGDVKEASSNRVFFISERKKRNEE